MKPPLDLEPALRAASLDQSAVRRFTRDYASIHHLSDGTSVRLRLLLPDDRAWLLRGFARLSPQSRYLRFFTAMPRLPETILGRLLNVDEWSHVAIGAESAAVAPREGDPFGAARFIRLAAAPHVAEAAVVVADHMQRRGLGRLLLRALAAAARERGITTFRAEVLAVNVGVTALIRELDGDARPVSVGGAVAVYEVPLPDAPSEEGA